MKASALLAKLRALYAALDDVSEGKHHASIAFKAHGRLFSTFREEDGDGVVVFGLEPEHASTLLDRDERFTLYPRAPHTLEARASQVEFDELKPLLLESYALVAKAKPKKPVTRPRRSPARSRRSAR